MEELIIKLSNIREEDNDMSIDIKVGSIITIDNKYSCMVCEDLINVFFLLDLKSGTTRGVGDRIYHYCNFYEFKQKILNTFDDIKIIHKICEAEP